MAEFPVFRQGKTGTVIIPGEIESIMEREQTIIFLRYFSYFCIRELIKMQ